MKDIIYVIHADAIVAGATEPLSNDIIKDLFFLHERGLQSGVLGMAFILFSTLAPLICGFLIQARGWPWYHWLVSILAGFDLLCIILFVPETSYTRDPHYALDQVGVSGEVVEKSLQDKDVLGPEISQVEGQPTTGTLSPKPYLQQLKPWSRMEPSSLGYAYLRPWLFLSFPAMIWTILSFSVHVSRYSIHFQSSRWINCL